MNLCEKLIKTEEIYNGRIMKVKKDSVILPNGEDATREIVELNGAAAVLPITEKGEIIMVRQYRCPFYEILLEIPAGKLDSLTEDPYVCAVRELKEETGAVASEIKFIGKTYPSPGVLKEVLWLYAATGLTFGSNDLDEDEFLETVKVPYNKALEMIKTGEIIDGKTICAILYYDRFMKGEK